MELSIRFNEPLLDCSRWEVEDKIVEWLGDGGEVVGAGTATDGSWSHIDIAIHEKSVDGMMNLVQEVRQLLQHDGIPKSTTLVVFDDEDNKLGEYPL